MPAMLLAAMRMLRPVQQIVITGNRGSQIGQQLVQTVFSNRKRHSSIAYLDIESDWLLSRNERYENFPRDDVTPIVYVVITTLVSPDVRSGGIESPVAGLDQLKRVKGSATISE